MMATPSVKNTSNSVGSQGTVKTVRDVRSGSGKRKKPEKKFSGFFERLAATYSRRTYRTTTIGPAVFDGRVRNGNGSDHCGIATKKRKSEARVQMSEVKL